MDYLDKSQLSRASRIAAHAVGLPAEDRSTYVAEACDDNGDLRDLVDLLVGSGMSSDDLLSDLSKVDLTALALDIGEDEGGIPEKIGPYRLLDKIGEGGFGIVFVAEQQEPLRRRVALKILKAGMDTKAVLARFEAERQALAMMDHPNIARVLDAGETDRGRPYFVMELVKGDSITEYCDKHRLSTRKRLALFEPVCRAVQHAHQKGIIHRDLKPSNILVSTTDDKPTPKVIDFGIAKAAAGLLTEKTLFTELGQVVGSPSYRSPEQAEIGNLDIDTRTDIYSLGVVLYQILSGTLPFDIRELRKKGLAEILRVVQEEDPPRPSDRVQTLDETSLETAQKRGTEPSTLNRQLRGELDWIVLKAMEKDRTRRYETAVELGADIRRYLKGEAIIAGPPSAVYRFRKFSARHKVGLGISALTLVTILGALLQTTLERTKAEKARADLEAVTDFQADMLTQIDPQVMGTWLIDDLKESIKRVKAQAGGDPEETTQLLNSLELALEGVNLTDTARRAIDSNVLAPALEGLDDAFIDQPLINAELRDRIAVAYRELGMLEKAEPLFRRSLADRLAESDRPDSNILATMNNLALVLEEQGKLDEAEQFYRDGLSGARQLLGTEHFETLKNLNNFAFLLARRGRLDEAEGHFHEVLEAKRRVLGNQDRSTITSMNNLGFILVTRGDPEGAEQYIGEALEAFRSLLGSEHADTLGTMSNLGSLYWIQCKVNEAEPLLHEALQGNRKALGSDHPQTLRILNNLASLIKEKGELEEAERLYDEVLESRIRVLGREHPDTLTSKAGYGNLLTIQQRYQEAEELLTEVVETAARVLPAEDRVIGYTLGAYGQLLHRLQRTSEAKTNLLQAQDILYATIGPNHPESQKVAAALADIMSR